MAGYDPYYKVKDSLKQTAIEYNQSKEYPTRHYDMKVPIQKIKHANTYQPAADLLSYSSGRPKGLHFNPDYDFHKNCGENLLTQDIRDIYPIVGIPVHEYDDLWNFKELDRWNEFYTTKYSAPDFLEHTLEPLPTDLIDFISHMDQPLRRLDDLKDFREFNKVMSFYNRKYDPQGKYWAREFYNFTPRRRASSYIEEAVAKLGRRGYTPEKLKKKRPKSVSLTKYKRGEIIPMHSVCGLRNETLFNRDSIDRDFRKQFGRQPEYMFYGARPKLRHSRWPEKLE